MRVLGWVPGLGMGEASCCAKRKLENEAMLRLLDRLCRIALAIFAAIIAPELFAISFGIGVAAAIVHACAYPDAIRSAGNLKPVCGQGYMEFLSGKSFEPWIVHVVTTLFVGAHVRHDPHFFVPFCGLFIGWRGGEEASAMAYHLSKRAVNWYEQPAKPCSSCS